MIVGFNFKKINVERKKKLVKGMKVTYNMDLSKVYKQEFTLPAPDQTVLGLDFDFTVGYGEGIADVAISGTVNYMANDKDAKEALEYWEKSKQLPKAISVPVINVILDKSNIKALELEQDLSLPTHLPMPSVSVGKDEKSKGKESEKYIG